jgi:polyisoprenoid-binding protein YceI
MSRQLAAALVLAAATAARAEPVVYAIDPQHSFVHFEVLHFGTSTLRGRFGQIEGTVEIDRAASTGWASLRIPTAAVDTGMPAFDARLRQSDLLDSEGYPVAAFVASRFSFDAAKVAALAGELTLRGVRQALELRALRFGCHTHPQLQREVCGGDFEGELKRADFGASFGMPFVANRVRLVVQVEGIRQ